MSFFCSLVSDCISFLLPLRAMVPRLPIELVAAHADAVVADRQRAALLVAQQLDAQLLVVAEQRVRRSAPGS
jgi:hypothetical protein